MRKIIIIAAIDTSKPNQPVIQFKKAIKEH